MIGMGSIIMNGCRIGRGSIIGAGSILVENQEIPPISLVVGSPGQVKKTYDEKIIEKIRISSSVYAARAAKFLQDSEVNVSNA